MDDRTRPDPLRSTTRTLWATIAVMLGIAVALSALAEESEGPSVFFTVLAGVCFLLLPLFYYLRRRYRREAEALIGGQYWARWRYQRAEWERFLHAEWATSRAKAARWALYFGLAGLAGGLLPGLADGNLAAGLPIGIAMALFFGGLLPGLLLWSAYATLQRGLAAEPEAWVGESGAYLGGRFIPWGSAGPRGVKLSPGEPAVLRFELHGRSDGENRPTIRIPVPSGQEQEAAALRDRFRERIRSHHR